MGPKREPVLVVLATKLKRYTLKASPQQDIVPRNKQQLKHWLAKVSRRWDDSSCSNLWVPQLPPAILLTPQRFPLS